MAKSWKKVMLCDCWVQLIKMPYTSALLSCNACFKPSYQADSTKPQAWGWAFRWFWPPAIKWPPAFKSLHLRPCRTGSRCPSSPSRECRFLSKFTQFLKPLGLLCFVMQQQGNRMRRMDTQIVVYPYYAILSSHKKEWSPETCNNTDESQRSYAEQKERDMQSMYCMIPFIWNSRKGRIDLRWIYWAVVALECD